METLMSEALSMSNPTTSKDTRNATSLRASADGHTPSNSQDGLPTGLCGRDHAHASLSAQQEKVLEPQTNGTSGLCSQNSSEPASLQFVLGSKLRQRLAGTGSPEYSLTWKEWDIQGQEPICALRASALRISDSDCSGWPTPKASEADKESRTPEGALKEVMRNKGPSLSAVSHLAGWGTPRVSSSKGLGNPSRACDGMARLEDQVHGLVSTPRAETEKPAASRLNPLFSLWLMGYPVEWGYCGAQAMQSFPKSRRSSSPLSKTQLSDRYEK